MLHWSKSKRRAVYLKPGKYNDGLIWSHVKALLNGLGTFWLNEENVSYYK